MNVRRARVLQLVAEAYIQPAHPVASGQVAERLDVSSATVRNDFGPLESEGLLQQMHTSTAPIPSGLVLRPYDSSFQPPDPQRRGKRSQLGQVLAGFNGEEFYALASQHATEHSGYADTDTLPPADPRRTRQIHLPML